MEADKNNRSHLNHHLHRPTTITNSTAPSNSSSGTTGELLICFSASRLSSSMKISSSSKSILSPGHRPSSRDQQQQPAQISLSSSLSRRLRTNGSIKGAGQASPMFPAGGGKKRGCAFDNPEPSSPKVTCIGQVRVKTKKQSKKLRTRSISTSRRPLTTPGGEGSFKKLERGISDGNAEPLAAAGDGMQFQQHACWQHNRNQRWAHLPLTICEALRTFGSEFNCFLPCRSSSCLAGDESKENEEKSATAVSGRSESNNGASCGAVFARWLVAVQERDVKGREIEVVAEGQEKEVEEEVYSSPEMQRRSYRRHHGFDEIDLDLKQEPLEGAGNDGREDSRMSICIPPKNALLLMRCRSDPVKMAALGNKFWNLPDVVKDSDEALADVDVGSGGNTVDEGDAANRQEEDEENEGLRNEVREAVGMEDTIVESDVQGTDSKCDEEATGESHHLQVCEESSADEQFVAQVSAVAGSEDVSLLKLEEEEEEAAEEESAMSIADEGIPVNEEISDLENSSAEYNNEEITTVVQADLAGGEGKIMVEDSDFDYETPMPEQLIVVTEEAVEELEVAAAAAAAAMEVEVEVEEENEAGGTEGSEPENPKWEGPSPTGQKKSKESENKNKNNNLPLLPDCLLLMMCEPKLSMEVSKETWVCSTDFIRWLPEPSRQVAVKKINGGEPPSSKKGTDTVDVVPEPVNEAKTKTGSQAQAQQQNQPPRSSCSYPAQAMAWRPGAESIGPGLEMKAYELPLVLTRCKSEPRGAAAKLAPEACCWKNRKLEPHRPRIGAAGVGF